MNTKQKIVAAAMVPLISGQSVFQEKAESLKADLQSMVVDLGEEGAVTLTGNFVSKQWCGHAGSYLSWADVDGDGIQDMLCDDSAGRHWALLIAKGGGIKRDLGMHQANWCSQPNQKTNWADVTGDGKADMLCDDKNGRHVANFNGLQGLAGPWAKQIVVLDQKYCTGGNFKWVDMNGNGKADMVCDYPASGSHWSQYSTGNGNFVNMGVLEKRFCHKHSVVNYADLNGDGNMDIICSHKDGHHHAVFLDGQGNVLPNYTDKKIKNFCVGHPEKVQFVDLNNDSMADMVCDIGGSHYTRLSSGDGSFTEFLSWHGQWCAAEGANVHWVDITGDGIPEMHCHSKNGFHWVRSITDWFEQTA